jgi:hypothetical protein
MPVSTRDWLSVQMMAVFERDFPPVLEWPQGLAQSAEEEWDAVFLVKDWTNDRDERPGVVEEPGMCRRSLRGNREIPRLTSGNKELQEGR